MWRVLQTVVIPMTTYGLHLCPYSADLQRAWNYLDEQIIRITLGWFSHRMRKRLQLLLGLRTLVQRIGEASHSLSQRTHWRAGGDNALLRVTSDPNVLSRAGQKLLAPKDTTREDILKQQQTQEAHYRRNITRPKNGSPPALCWKNSRLRRAAVKRYCGLFPYDIRPCNQHMKFSGLLNVLLYERYSRTIVVLQTESAPKDLKKSDSIGYDG